jgi:hypothetical protein
LAAPVFSGRLAMSIIEQIEAGGYVFVPPGTYEVSQTIRVRAGTTIQGAGSHLSVIKMTSPAAVSTLILTGSDITIAGVTLLGPREDTTWIQSQNAIFAEPDRPPANNIRIQGLRILRFGNHGIEMHYVDDAIICDNTIEYVSRAGVVCRTCNRMLVRNNYVRHVTPGDNRRNAYGIAVSNTSNQPVSTDCLITGNIVEDVPSWEGLDCHSAERIIFSNNIVRQCRVGIHVGMDKGPLRDVTISNNLITAEGGTLFLLFSTNPLAQEDVDILDGGTIPEVVRQAFAANGRRIDSNDAVATVTTGSSWRINVAFVIQNEGAKLNVYGCVQNAGFGIVLGGIDASQRMVGGLVSNNVIRCHGGHNPLSLSPDPTRLARPARHAAIHIGWTDNVAVSNNLVTAYNTAGVWFRHNNRNWLCTGNFVDDCIAAAADNPGILCDATNIGFLASNRVGTSIKVHGSQVMQENNDVRSLGDPV